MDFCCRKSIRLKVLIQFFPAGLGPSALLAGKVVPAGRSMNLRIGPFRFVLLTSGYFPSTSAGPFR